MSRIALGVEYAGHGYCGWQRQPDCISLQQCLETALSQVADAPITVSCAGRTDAGVHATGQVVHFDSQAVRRESAWTIGVNAHLPSTLSVRWAKRVVPTFHARFSALARHYRYIIDNSPLRPALLSHAVTHFPRLLNVATMHRAGQSLLGEHDFTSFRALQCQSHSPWRYVMRLDITQQGQYIVINIKANAFVHHMVRNIVGALIKVGTGQRPVTWIADLLAFKDRTQGAETAKANGLYLVKVDYPTCFELPSTPLGPLFLAE